MPIVSDSKTWTKDFVRNNFDDCSNALLTTLEVSKKFLLSRDYNMSVHAFNEVIIGLELLSDVDDYFLSYLYSNEYALGRIYAFGLDNRNKSIEYIEKACMHAGKCSINCASRDKHIMADVLSELKKGTSFTKIKSIFNINFPYDVLANE